MVLSSAATRFSWLLPAAGWSAPCTPRREEAGATGKPLVRQSSPLSWRFPGVRHSLGNATLCHQHSHGMLLFVFALEYCRLHPRGRHRQAAALHPSHPPLSQTAQSSQAWAAAPAARLAHVPAYLDQAALPQPWQRRPAAAARPWAAAAAGLQLSAARRSCANLQRIACCYCCCLQIRSGLGEGAGLRAEGRLRGGSSSVWVV